MQIITRSFLYLASFIIPIVLTGALGIVTSVRTSMPRPAGDVAALTPPAPPPYDPAKPTVAVVLGSEVHEIVDTIGPYAMFVESGLYNVYMVAETRKPRALGTRTAYVLSGEVDIIPHLTFAELAAQLGRHPDIVVVPQMTGITAPTNRPLLDYIRQQAQTGSLIFSWCTGANVLAAAGLLDGQPATAHWGDIDRLQGEYPNVSWQRGVRYVDAGSIMTTGGVTSGIDGTLYLLGKLHGPEVAERVARALRYQPIVELDSTPSVEQYTFGPAESIVLLNAAFTWDKRELGVWLYDGVGDLELAAVLDSYPPTMSARTYTVAATRGILTTQYGLQLVPHWEVNALPTIDRLLVPGGPDAAKMDASLAAAGGRITAPITRIHAGEAHRTAFEAPVEDVARDQNVPSAAFAAKRMEYRGAGLQMIGPGWPLLLVLQPLLIGAAGVSLAWWLTQLAGRGQRRLQRAAAAHGRGSASWNQPRRS
jgi:AraC family transcriptional regulator, transcriptional activator FtrA